METTSITLTRKELYDLVWSNSLDDKYWLQFAFYLEQVNGVHFIDTIHKKEKKKIKEETAPVI